MASTINITKSSPGNIIITGKWTWYDYYKVEYSWENAPDGVTLPETINKIKNGSIIAVDTTYSSSSEVDTNDYYYTFSGWNKSGNITVNADTTITGIWTQNRYLTVSYSWTDAPTSVTLPNSTTKLKPGDSVTVDTTYNSSSEVDTDIKEKVVLSERSISNTNRKWTSVCYGNGKFVAVDNTNYFAYSNDGITWSESTISDTSRQWTSVCYGNGKFVAVGSGDDNQHVGGSTSNTKNFAYSTDGIKWTEGALGYDVEWSSVCYGNGKFVAVSNSFNYFAYSTDGINWTKGTISSTSRYWNSVCYGNNKYVAVGSHTEASGGTYSYFAYSTNGINWTEGTISSTSRYWNSVCYGNGMFVTVASRTNYFAYSTDGITWTEGTISSTSRNWRSVCYGNGMFVAVANNSYFAYSTDGINWTEDTISSTSRNWRSVCYGNDKFVAVSNSSNYFAYVSNNLTNLNKTVDISYNWTITDGGPGLSSNIIIPNGTSYKFDLNDDTSYTYTIDETYTAGMIDEHIDDTHNGCYEFSGWNVSEGITWHEDNISKGYSIYSTDSITWTETSEGLSGRNWYSLCYGNGIFVAVAYNDNYFAYSTDGITWTEGTISNTSRNWYFVCYGNGKFITVARGTNYFAYSTDGITWTEGIISDTERYWQSLCYGNDKFVTVANNDNYFAYSTDGITWTEGTISDTSRYWMSVCYGNGMFIAVARGTKEFSYSTDGITWTEGTISDTSRNWNSVCYGNGKFIAIASSTVFAYSTDGITWTEGIISDTSRNCQSVCYGNSSLNISYGDSTLTIELYENTSIHE